MQTKLLLSITTAAWITALPALAGGDMRPTTQGQEQAQTATGIGGAAAAGASAISSVVVNANSGRAGGAGNGRGAGRGAAGRDGAAGNGGGLAGNGGGAGGRIDARSAPDVLLGTSWGGGAECPVVGLGVGAAGMSGSGILSGATISQDCMMLKVARYISGELGQPDIAWRVVIKHYPEVAEAVKEAHAANNPVASATAAYTAPPAAPRPSWCNRARPATEASRAYYAQNCGG